MRCGVWVSSMSWRSPRAVEKSARAKADALGIPKAYGSYEALAADPGRARRAQHHAEQPARAGHHGGAHASQARRFRTSRWRSMQRTRARSLNAAREAGVVHAVTFNYRGNPLVQQAREMIAAGEIGEPHFVHGAYLQDWLLHPTDFSWRLEQGKGGKSSAIGDIGSHWCDLVQHVIGRRIEAVLADFQTVIPTRFKPSKNREAFARADERGEEFHVESEDLATVLVRFEGGARGRGVRRPGVRRSQERSLVRGERRPGIGPVVSGAAERAVDWPARRPERDAPKDPSLLARRRAALCALAWRASGGMGRRVLQRHAGYLRIHRERPESVQMNQSRPRLQRSTTDIAPPVSSMRFSRATRAEGSGRTCGIDYGRRGDKRGRR